MVFSEAKIGAEVIVNQSWVGMITERKQGSNTVFYVEDIERGKGWDEKTQSYKGYKTSNNGWVRGQNYDFGSVHPVHIKNMEVRHDI